MSDPVIPGVMNDHDRRWKIIHPSGAEVSFTDYNQEITGHTDDADKFPVLGKYIKYGGNAYYVVGEANRLGWMVVDLNLRCYTESKPPPYSPADPSAWDTEHDPALIEARTISVLARLVKHANCDSCDPDKWTALRDARAILAEYGR